MPGQNETHDPSLESFVTSAQAPGCYFTIQNQPFAIFRKGRNEQFRGGVAIGDQVLDLAGICKRDLLSGEAREAAESCIDTTLNAYMALGPAAWSALRLALSRLLRTANKKVAEVRGS